jgi:folate-dependent phosphoribosylglycinamide formyltransferase PurN
MSNDQSIPNVAIFAGDNIFTYLLMSMVLKKVAVDKVYLSSYNSNFKKIKSIYSKTSRSYFIYRSFIQVLSKFNKTLSIKKFAQKNNIPIEYVSSKKDINAIDVSKIDMVLAANFDIIIPTDFINSLKYGVLNVHAANLPKDKGISPVVWAYCRGDKEIYTSFYLMDGGIDTGPILKKERITIQKNWSLFRTYCEVLIGASITIPKLINGNNLKTTQPLDPHNSLSESYNSWPNGELHKVMKTTKRTYFKLSDFTFLAKLKNKL